MDMVDVGVDMRILLFAAACAQALEIFAGGRPSVFGFIPSHRLRNFLHDASAFMVAPHPTRDAQDRQSESLKNCASCQSH